MEHGNHSDHIQIRNFTSTDWSEPVFNGTHYQIIVINRGQGEHEINGTGFRYQNSDIFLLVPGDKHFFFIDVRTEFTSFHFTEPSAISPDSDWLKEIVSNSNSRLFRFNHAPSDQHLALRMIELILVLHGDSERNNQLICFQIAALLSLLKRHLTESRDKFRLHKSHRILQQLFLYIHCNICNAKQLRAAALAEKFNTTESYIGKLFKRHAGVTLRNYIADYRKLRITERLPNSSGKQLVQEFGLTDESHLSKILHAGKRQTKDKNDRS